MRLYVCALVAGVVITLIWLKTRERWLPVIVYHLGQSLHSPVREVTDAFIAKFGAHVRCESETLFVQYGQGTRRKSCKMRLLIPSLPSSYICYQMS